MLVLHDKQHVHTWKLPSATTALSLAWLLEHTGKCIVQQPLELASFLKVMC